MEALRKVRDFVCDSEMFELGGYNGIDSGN